MNEHAHHRIGHSLILAGAFLVLLSTAFFGPLTTYRSYAFGNSEIISQTNKQRALYSAPELKANTRLTSAAQEKAEAMVKQRFFAHTAPDGTMAWDYIKKVGYAYDVAGENLAITNESAEVVMESWMNSPSHRENILNNDYRDIGIGIASYGDYQGHQGTTVIVALYAKSAGVQVVGAPTNPAGSAAILKTAYPQVPGALIGGIAALVIAVGVTLEIRHVRRLHHAAN